MPRSRKRRPAVSAPREESWERFLNSQKYTEVRRGREWCVQPVSAHQAEKEYVCPGCTVMISVGTAHVVAWRADGVLGDAAELAARRHWHAHCWKVM